MSTKNNFLFLGFYPRRGTRASGWRPPFRHQGRLSRRRGQYQAFIERRGKNEIVLYLYALKLKYLTQTSQVHVYVLYEFFVKAKRKPGFFPKSQEFFVKAKRKPRFFSKKLRIFLKSLKCFQKAKVLDYLF